MKPHTQIFQIDMATLDTAMGDGDEFEATVKGLKEAGLYALPFDEVNVRLPGDLTTHFKNSGSPMIKQLLARGLVVPDKRGDGLYSSFGHGHWTEYRRISLDHINFERWVHIDVKQCKHFTQSLYERYDMRYDDGKAIEHNTRIRDMVCDMLIVLLATRNAVKSTTQNKLAKLGIGTKKKPPYEYVTTISVPKELEPHPDHAPTGKTVCPHLRRGHFRNQRFGPRLSFSERKWIAPMFVNADKEWARHRKAYNLSGLMGNNVAEPPQTTQ